MSEEAEKIPGDGDNDDLDPEDYMQRNGKAVIDKEIVGIWELCQDSEHFETPTSVTSAPSKSVTNGSKSIGRKFKKVLSDVTNFQWDLKHGLSHRKRCGTQ